MSDKETKKLLRNVLAKITPTKKELDAEHRIVKELVREIEAIEGKHVRVLLAGSMARNTHLRGDRDIDLFVMFPKHLDREEFEMEGLRIGKKVLGRFEWEEAFSEHPYIRGVVKGFEVEVVPSYEIESTRELKSSVDRTPFHNKYLLERLSEEQRGEVRLLRQFLKGIGSYGADLKTGSVPGYVTELLVLKYGSFLDCLKAVCRWKKGEVIDIERLLPKAEAQKRFHNASLVIIDPIDESRNVAAALSEQQFNRFIAAARAFLEKPSGRFFFGRKERPWPEAKLEKALERKKLLAVEIAYPKGVIADIVWGQLKSLARKIANQLALEEFVVERSAEWTDEKKGMVVLFELESLDLEKTAKRIGPEVTDLESSLHFFEKHKRPVSGPRIEKGRWVVEALRKHWNAKLFLKEALGKASAGDRAHIHKAMKKHCRVLDGKGLLGLARKNNGFKVFLTKYLKGKEEFLDY